MMMQTEILSSPSDQIRENLAREQPEQAVPIGGLLQVDEAVNGYTVQRRMAADTGEAEIYICAKDGGTFILKYYYTKRPKEDVLKKLKGAKHPDIVQLIEYGDYNSRFYEILEYAEGVALNEKTRDGSWKYLPVTEENVLQIVKEAVNAFAACHKAGIIHRDIKPGNLFYKNANGTDLLIGDFGISSSYDIQDGMSKHLTQTAARTEGYAAPEAYSGVIGPETDYYSLGVPCGNCLPGKILLRTSMVRQCIPDK
jgi:serine/threonine protein kinase